MWLLLLAVTQSASPAPSSSKMAAPRSVGDGSLWGGLAAAFFLLQLLLSSVGAKDDSLTAEFDVRPGGMVHSFSKSLGDFSCTFTYAAQGGTNEKWQMSLGASEKDSLFSCSVWRPQGKSYLFFTQFKAEVQGARIHYAMAYSTAASGGQSDIPLTKDEFYTTETTVSHKEGKFRSELSKLLLIAGTSHEEL